MRTLISLMLAVSAFSFGLGITLPLMRFEHLFVFTRTPSLIEMVGQLWVGGDWLLGTVVAVFSIVFPAAKILSAQALLTGPGVNAHLRRRLHGFLGLVSKWSMMDVLIVALVIVAAKTSGFADAFTQPGLWFYTISVIAAAVATYYLAREDA